MEFSELDKRDRADENFDQPIRDIFDCAVPHEGSIYSNVYTVVDNKELVTLTKLPVEEVVQRFGNPTEVVGNIDVYELEDGRTGAEVSVHVYLSVGLEEEEIEEIQRTNQNPKVEVTTKKYASRIYDALQHTADTELVVEENIHTVHRWFQPGNRQAGDFKDEVAMHMMEGVLYGYYMEKYTIDGEF